MKFLLRKMLTVVLCVFSWCGSHIRWGQAFRLRHLSTGHYLALTEDRGLVLQDREKSDTKATAFCFKTSKVSAARPQCWSGWRSLGQTHWLSGQCGVRKVKKKNLRSFP